MDLSSNVVSQVCGTSTTLNGFDRNGYYGQPLEIAEIRSYQEWSGHAVANHGDHLQRKRLERQLATGAPFSLNGYCYVCRSPAKFDVDYRYAYKVDELLTPNWREQLACRRCGLNNRMRAAIHLFREYLRPAPYASILIAEQITPLFQWFAANYDTVVGFEHLGAAVPLGQERSDGIRNENLTALTVSDCAFNFVLTFDVFEHVPAVKQAFAECWRVLAPGGQLFFSVPFLVDSPENTVRAVQRDDGVIEHLLPPEYHGDPLSSEGCLAFYHFGWEMLDMLNDIGFRDPRGYVYWSDVFGYLGTAQTLFSAEKPQAVCKGRVNHSSDASTSGSS